MNVNEYPIAIESAALQLAKVSGELSCLREQIKSAETETTFSVCEARDSGGSLLYKNDRAREFAIHLALKGNDVYQQELSRERELEAKKAELAARLERLRKGYAIALIDYEAEKLGRRVAA